MGCFVCVCDEGDGYSSSDSFSSDQEPTTRQRSVAVTSLEFVSVLYCWSLLISYFCWTITVDMSLSFLSIYLCFWPSFHSDKPHRKYTKYKCKSCPWRQKHKGLSSGLSQERLQRLWRWSPPHHLHPAPTPLTLAPRLSTWTARLLPSLLRDKRNPLR